jgi:hypothetical protein
VIYYVWLKVIYSCARPIGKWGVWSAPSTCIAIYKPADEFARDTLRIQCRISSRASENKTETVVRELNLRGQGCFTDKTPSVALNAR